jgi:TolA-binding protein
MSPQNAMRSRSSVLAVGVAAVLALIALGGIPVRAEDEKPASESVKPMDDLSAELTDLEGKVDAAESEVASIQKGRLGTVIKEQREATRTRLQSRVDLARLMDSLKAKVYNMHKTEYNSLLDGHRRRLADLKRLWDSRLRHTTDTYTGTYRYYTVAQYEAAVKAENDNYEHDLSIIQADADKDLDAEKAKVADQISGLQGKIQKAEDDLKRLDDEREQLGRQIAGIQKTQRDNELALLRVRRLIADRPAEAFAAGLRPRNGRYVLDTITGELSVSGGVWSKPADTAEWRASHNSQSRGLMTLATQMRDEGKTAFARKCLQRLIEEFPQLDICEQARKMLAEL